MELVDQVQDNALHGFREDIQRGISDDAGVRHGLGQPSLLHQ